MKYWFPCKPNRLAPGSELFRRLDNNIGWIAEVKKNGWRCLAYRETDSVTLWTRHRTTINDPLPEIRSALSTLPDGTAIDGELLQNRTKHIKGIYYVFDLVAFNGALTTGLPLWQRRELLETVIQTDGSIELARQYRIGKLKLYHDSIQGEENEGIVLKKLDSTYNESESRCLQNPYWLKVKRIEKHVYL